MALIDARHVNTLIAARKVGLPLSSAAEMAGVPGEWVQTWLTYGRRADQLGARKSSAPYIETCREFARQWDTALIGTIALLRGYLIGHAKRDPKACVTALQGYEREYSARKGRRLTSEADESSDAYQPLDLVAQQAQPKAKLTHTSADGSTTSLELAGGGAFEAEADGRTDAELEHYAEHGYWPHEEPKEPPIDTTAEDIVEPDLEVEEEIARLQGTAKREGEGQASRSVEANPIRPPDGPTRPFVGPVQVAPPLQLPPPPARALKRIEPQEGLPEAEPVVPVPEPPKPTVAIPAFTPLKRVDPEAMR